MNTATKSGGFSKHHYSAPIFDTMIPPSSVLYPSFPHKSKSSATMHDDTELSIFDAEKYFNETNDHLGNGDSGKRSFQSLQNPPALPRLSSASSSTDVYGRNCRTRSYQSYATPTASSEASWNSQTGLLTNPPGSVPVSVRDPSSEWKRAMVFPRWQGFRTKCPCLGRKSVSINQRNLSSELRSVPPVNNVRSRIQVSRHASTATDGSYENKQQNPSTQAKLCSEDIGKSILNSHCRFSSEMENLFPSEIGCKRSSIIAGRPFSDATSIGFTFPIVKASISSTTAAPPSSPPIKNMQNGLTISSTSLLDDLPRDSLEVFEPSNGAAFSRPRNQIHIQPPPKTQYFTVPPLQVIVPGRKDGPFSMDDDDGSDASSDLFEIESISTQSTAYPNHRQRDSLDEARPRFSTNTCNTLPLHYNGNTTAQMLDNDRDRYLVSMPHVMTESAYEPSEASVTWSVTTADGPLGDRGSVVTSYSVSASDADEFTRLQLRLHRDLEMNGSRVTPGQGANLAMVGGGGKRCSVGNNNGGLLSCRSEKAVSVGPNPVSVKLVSDEKGTAVQGRSKGSAANNDATVRPLSRTTIGGGPFSGPLTRHASSRPPPVSKTGPQHSTRVSMALAT